jgi:RNA polymerase sigma factor (sigma-70 family)
VYAITKSILKDYQQAEDAAQETWVRVSEALDRGSAPDLPDGWIGTIAYREARRIAIARRKQGPVAPLVEHPPVEGSHNDVANRDEVEKVLGKIPADDRKFLVRRFLEGWTPEELRHEYGYSSVQLWERTSKACRKLRRVVRGGKWGRRR